MLPGKLGDWAVQRDEFVRFEVTLQIRIAGRRGSAPLGSAAVARPRWTATTASTTKLRISASARRKRVMSGLLQWKVRPGIAPIRLYWIEKLSNCHARGQRNC